MRRIVEIEGKYIGDGCPIYIVFEAGQTHQGFEDAKRLIKAAKESGADAIKFQMYDTERLIAAKTLPDKYSIITENGEVVEKKELLIDTLKRKEFTKDEWIKLKVYADEQEITFFSTFCFEDELNFLIEELKVSVLKICSADIDHYWLLKLAADTAWPVIIDTGSATLGEVENAVDILRRQYDHRTDEIIINHCPSGFPADISSVNLRMITTLRQVFDYPIAFSDHNSGIGLNLAAVALGVDMLEKTITTDQYCPEPEHMVSMPINLCSYFVGNVRQIEEAMGNNRIILEHVDINKIRMKRRGIYVNKNLKSGHIISEEDLEFRKPVFITRAKDYDLFLGRILAYDMQEGEELVLEDLSEDE